MSAALPPAESDGPRVGTVLLVALALAALYVGRAVFVPLALALLLSVALSPAVDAIHRLRVKRVVAVLVVMLVTLAVIMGFLLLLASQLLALAEQLPQHEENLRARLAVLSQGSGVLDRAWETIRHLGEELSARDRGALPPVDSSAEPARTVAAPPASPLATLLGVAEMVVGPVATFAIALLLMAYLLLGRDDVRDRFLRLVGTHDLHRTTRVLADATRRVGRYLLMTLTINASFGAGMGIGLLAIGVPSAPLWGLLCFVLRFVPFLGAPLSVLFPLFMAFATGSGWTEPILVVLLFLVVDGVITYVLEPMLYGGSTGLSPLALLVSSALWTVLWGPVGLVLAPAMTACLVIIGRHVPGLAFLEILLGNVEPLPPETRFYQRLLAGDPRGAEEIAEAELADGDLRGVLRDLVVPALETLRRDRRAGMVPDVGLAPLAAAIEQMLRDFEDEPPPLVAETGVVGVAGVLDHAAAVAAASFLRESAHSAVLVERGDRDVPPLRLAILCMVEPPSTLRLRRALTQARASAERVVALVLGETTPERLAMLGEVEVFRTLDALATALGPSSPVTVVEEPRSAEIPPDAAAARA